MVSYSEEFLIRTGDVSGEPELLVLSARIGDDPPASDCRADHKSSTDKYDILDDVLAFERRRIRHYREDVAWKQKDGRYGSHHLHEEQ